MILNRELQIGEKYSQEKIEEVFDTSFGYQISGINIRRSEDDKKYIILTSKEEGPYNDEISEYTKEFFYIGEGLPDKGDQKRTARNLALIDSIQEEIPIFFFVSRETGQWEYKGLVNVLSHRYIDNGERKVFRFKMEILEIADPSKYEEAQREIIEKSQESPELEDKNVNYETTNRRVRSAIFSKEIKKLYQERCAICGTNRYSPDGKPEVEAAHIYPKEENGADDLRNGLALCKLHHWAFDCGWISLTDDLKIIIKDKAEEEIPDFIARLEEKGIYMPEQTEFSPHPKFIRAHRRLYGFE